MSEQAAWSLRRGLSGRKLRNSNPVFYVTIQGKLVALSLNQHVSWQETDGDLKHGMQGPTYSDSDQLYKLLV